MQSIPVGTTGSFSLVVMPEHLASFQGCDIASGSGGDPGWSPCHRRSKSDEG
jgi:hypothetical protein